MVDETMMMLSCCLWIHQVLEGACVAEVCVNTVCEWFVYVLLCVVSESLWMRPRSQFWGACVAQVCGSG